MNQKEFKNLTKDLLQGLEKKMLEIDGDIRFEQVNTNTFFIFLNDGNVNSKDSVFEFYITGDEAKWKWRGFAK